MYRSKNAALAVGLIGLVACVVAAASVAAHVKHGKRFAPDSAVQAPNPLVATHIENGAAIFREQCSTCHGMDGKGAANLAGPQPPDLSHADMLGMTDGEVHWVVTNGIPESGMPAFGDDLSDREAWQVASYVKNLWTNTDMAGMGMPKQVTIRFRAKVGLEDFVCGGSYDNVGTTNSTITPLDFRLYTHNFRLLDENGTEVPVSLEQDGMWQLDNLALLDFEDGTGPCSNGTEQLNVSVRGQVPAGNYTGLRFTLGVPFELNHRDHATQPSPLNLSSLFWVWNAGYKFARFDMKTTGNPQGYFIHLGSTGCAPNDTVNTVPTTCEHANRAEVTLHGFDVDRDEVLADLGALLAGADVDVNTNKRFQGCMSARQDASCMPLFDTLGITGEQRFFQSGSTATRTADDDFEWNLPPGFPVPRVPDNNPMSVAKVELGRHLFYDERLSVTGDYSCATCHEQGKAFTDAKAGAVGATGMIHPRSSMALVNVAYMPVYTWGNPNVRNLEEQALGPMFGEEPVELGLAGIESKVLASIRAVAEYQELFPASFPDDADPFTIARITDAIAAFERTLISGTSPYDRYRFGGDTSAISASAKRGEALFFSERLECFHCHGGFNFSGPTDYVGKGILEIEFHNTGLYNLNGDGSYPEHNTGTHELTGNAADMGHFKAPTLRNIELTAPYMHDGSVATLDEVLDHYAAGGRGDGHANPFKSGFVRGFTLTSQERKDVTSFLLSLTDESFLNDPSFSDPWQSETSTTGDAQ